MNRKDKSAESTRDYGSDVEYGRNDGPHIFSPMGGVGKGVLSDGYALGSGDVLWGEGYPKLMMSGPLREIDCSAERSKSKRVLQNCACMISVEEDREQGVSV